MTPLAKLREELLKFLPHVDIIEESTGELSILTRLTLDKDSLVPFEVSANEGVLRDLFTESLLPPYEEPVGDSGESDFQTDIQWDFE